MSVSRVLVYGGRGALGAACVAHFKSLDCWVTSVDLNPNESADANVTVDPDANWLQQEQQVVDAVAAQLAGEKLTAVICVAGGWAGGDSTKDLSKTAELMARQSVCSSTISATVAARFLAPGGLLVLTGANAALEPTPSMLGYGMAKAAVHHLTRSLGAEGSGLPAGALAVAIMPVTLDTPMNRKWMPKADFSTWTPLTFLAEQFAKWMKGEGRPKSGSLVAVVTKDNQTELTVQ